MCSQELIIRDEKVAFHLAAFSHAVTTSGGEAANMLMKIVFLHVASACLVHSNKGDKAMHNSTAMKAAKMKMKTGTEKTTQKQKQECCHRWLANGLKVKHSSKVFSKKAMLVLEQLKSSSKRQHLCQND